MIYFYKFDLELKLIIIRFKYFCHSIITLLLYSIVYKI